MNTTQYEAFLKAVELGTLTDAAEALGYTQSGLTRALNSLEKQLDCKLLHRDRRGVRLTTEGKFLLPYMERVLYHQHRLEAYADKLRGLDTGVIRIATCNSISVGWLPGMIQSFKSAHPDIEFELVHSTVKQSEDWAAAGKVDLAFIKYPPLHDDIEAEFLYRDPILGIFSGEDSLSRREVLPIAMLAGLPYVSLNEGVNDEITEILQTYDIHPDTRFTESDDHAVVAMVEQGLGMSLMSRLMLKGFSHDIATVPLDPPVYRDLGIAYKDRADLSSAAEAFLACAKEWLAENGYEAKGEYGS